MIKRPTLASVAKQAGVSLATASLILSNKSADRFRPHTRRRVQQAAAALRYQPRAPKPTASQVKLISWLHPVAFNKMDQKRIYDGEILGSIIEAAQQQGCHVTVGGGFSDVSQLPSYIAEHCRGTVDGLIIAGNFTASALREATHQGLPAVYVGDSTKFCDGMNGVYADSFQGGQLAARHLLELGHRRFAVVIRTARKYIQARLAGFRDVLSDAAIDCNSIPCCDWESPDFEKSLDEALTGPGRATALFITGGDMMVDLMAYIKRRNIAVPGKLSIVSYDEWPENKAVKPPLTTVANSRVTLGQVAFKRLMELINQPDQTLYNILVPNELIIRDSTAAPPSVR